MTNNQTDTSRATNLKRDTVKAENRSRNLTENKLMSNTISNFGFGNGDHITEEDNFIEPDFFDSPKDQIKLNTKYGTSLRIHLEELDLIPEFDETSTLHKKKLNNENLFKKKNTIKSKIILNSEREELDEMNKFNNEIITDSKWGSTNKRKGGDDNLNTMQFNKPNKKEVEKELGKNIVNTKIPRARLLTKVKDPNFYKIANKTGGAFGTSSLFNDSFHNNNNNFNKTGLNFKEKSTFRK